MGRDLKFGRIITDPTCFPQRDAVHFPVAQVTYNNNYGGAGNRVGLVPDTADVVTANYDYVDANNWIGIVDPFIPASRQLNQGDRVWLFLRPGSTSEPVHHWRHPAFNDPPPAGQSTATPWRTTEVVALCRHIRQTQDVGRLAELYDLVTKAGYPDTDGRFVAEAVNVDTPWTTYLLRLADIEGGEVEEALDVIRGWALKFEKPVGHFFGVTANRAKGERAYAVSHGFDTPNYTTQELDDLWTAYEVLTGDSVEEDNRGSFFSCSC